MEAGFVAKSLIPGFLEQKANELNQHCLIEEGAEWRKNVRQMKTIRNLVYVQLAAIACLYKTQKASPLLSAIGVLTFFCGICSHIVDLHKRAIAYKQDIAHLNPKK